MWCSAFCLACQSSLMRLTDWLFFNPAPDNSPPDVVSLAVAHPVMHQVAIRAHPDGGSIPAQIKGKSSRSTTARYTIWPDTRVSSPTTVGAQLISRRQHLSMPGLDDVGSWHQSLSRQHQSVQPSQLTLRSRFQSCPLPSRLRASCDAHLRGESRHM